LASLVIGVCHAEDEEAHPTVARTDIASAEQDRRHVVTQSAKAVQDSSKPSSISSRNKPCDVFQEEGARSEFSEMLEGERPQVALVLVPFLIPGGAERLARESAEPQVNAVVASRFAKVRAAFWASDGA
jgi:hypothetical protein